MPLPYFTKGSSSSYVTKRVMSRGDPRLGRPDKRVKLFQLEQSFPLACRFNNLPVFDNFDQLFATFRTPDH